ncbi:MAG: RNA methyltransferase [Deltaproteobacteria bacterium]|nr:RNA methyltransferase [Deltaproteobacteria bacterium]
MRKDSPDVFAVRLTPPLLARADEVVQLLSSQVTPERLARIREVAARRSFGVVPVLEHLTDPFNTSAIMRSAEAFGVHRVEVIPEREQFLAAPVSRGAHRWLELRRHDDGASCARVLHEEGYEIFVATMEGELGPRDLAAREKVAVVFGNEHAGVSSALREAADGTYAVPMSGFVESLNVSVAAAITLFEATRGREGSITPEQHTRVVAQLLMSTVTHSDAIVREGLSGTADAEDSGNPAQAPEG